jgi:hypothetical protein
MTEYSPPHKHKLVPPAIPTATFISFSSDAKEHFQTESYFPNDAVGFGLLLLLLRKRRKTWQKKQSLPASAFSFVSLHN